MPVTLSHTCRRTAIAEDAGPSGEQLRKTICELNNDLRMLSEQAPCEQGFERFEREVHQRSWPPSQSDRADRWDVDRVI